MKCNTYATLGVYRNIMMPVTKSDFRRKKKVTTESYTVENPNSDNKYGKLNNKTFQDEFASKYEYGIQAQK